MKAMKILQAVLLVGILALGVGCSTNRAYRAYPPPPPGIGVSLIVSPAPGLVLRYSNGNYYYRDPRGYVYWRGYDNRYYLDRRYVNRSYYNHREYPDWHRNYNGRRHRR